MLSFDILRFIWSHPSNHQRRLRTVGQAVGWQLQKRLCKTCRDIPVFGHLRLRCHPDSRGAGLMIYTNGWYDYDEMYFVQRYLRPGDAVVDIGANIGVYTLLAASCVGDQGRVLAFEPSRQVYTRLEENVRMNGLDQVEAQCLAIGSAPGTVQFLQELDVSNRISVSSDQTGELGRVENVPCITLDMALEGTRFALGKIDIEGAEYMVFQGGPRMLQEANPPIWLLELKDRLLRRFGSSAAELSQLLRNAGYELAVYNANRRQLLFCDAPWHERGNVLAIHRSAREAIQTRLSQDEVAVVSSEPPDVPAARV